MTRIGTVYLVGAGSGDPKLVTLRAVELLQRADEVLYDYLVNPAILRHAPPTAELVCLGRHGRSSLWPVDKIQARMVASARQGKLVIRLKSGDPMVFGRAAGEIEALAQAEIPFEIVPGITAAMAASAYAGVPLTDRSRASAVALVTGQENPNKADALLDFHRLAEFPGTLVVYMGVTTAPIGTAGLIAGGLPPETPVALVRRCSWPSQALVHCRLDEVTGLVTPYAKFPPPVVAIVGEVARRVPHWNWFQSRPLLGVSVLVTRPRHQAQELVDQLELQGAEVLLQPAIEILPPMNWDAVDTAFSRRSHFDGVIFCSSNGVQSFLGRIFDQGYDSRSLSGLDLFAVGSATAKSLLPFGLKADGIPDGDFRAEGLVDLLRESAPGRRLLVVRANRGRDVLARQLRKAGAKVEEVVAYRSVDIETLDETVAERVDAGTLDWVVASSSAIGRSTVALLGTQAQSVKWLSISPVTTETLGSLGVTVECEAAQATVDDLVRVLCERVTAERGGPASAHD